MKPAMSERWARFILRQRYPSGPWYPAMSVFTCLVMVANLIVVLTRDDTPPRVVCVATCAAVVTVMVTFVMWERMGVRRVVEEKDAEIRRLRGETHAT